MSDQTVRSRVGWWLRCLADRIDDEHAPRITSWSFTFERNRGVVFHHADVPMHGRGCPIVYFTDDYDRAHEEAENPL
ncbi:hypothetical protein SEA_RAYTHEFIREFLY_70 [Gordonia phage RayTheFireFly]|nr:hypothetical protein SEA_RAYTHEFIREFLY_70 [Gordonia phage RayTheFireFly]